MVLEDGVDGACQQHGFRWCPHSKQHQCIGTVGNSDVRGLRWAVQGISRTFCFSAGTAGSHLALVLSQTGGSEARLDCWTGLPCIRGACWGLDAQANRGVMRGATLW